MVKVKIKTTAVTTGRAQTAAQRREQEAKKEDEYALEMSCAQEIVVGAPNKSPNLFKLG